MRRRQHLPQLWMMTDERQGEGLWPALERLPRGSGVVFRHYSLTRSDRRALFERVRRIVARRGLVLLIAGSSLGRPPADGTHGWANGPGLRSASVHNLREVRAAERMGIDLLFLGPVFPTRSHPGARTLGPLRFAALARQTNLPVIALGGMSAARARRVIASGLYGWAAIDAWSD